MVVQRDGRRFDNLGVRYSMSLLLLNRRGWDECRCRKDVIIGRRKGDDGYNNPTVHAVTWL